MTKPRIAFLCGSLRKDSFHRRLGQAIFAATDRIECVPVELGDLPLYNQDLDGKQALEAWARFRDAVRPTDGVLFGSPEYNRSMTGALKNALDVGSRPYGRSVFAKKPAAVFSASSGMTGGFGSNHALRQSCVFLDMPVMQQPEAYWGLINDDKIGLDGTVHDETVAKLVKAFANAFADWVDLIGHGRAKIAPDPTQQAQAS
ncbi:MAG: NAD(P)H-dependent oxidoreductase [Sphingomonas sp.]|uniref:NADPH-dependent FMN reductase n=1 Tax=Sphingomonas sp. TaxID=28214 RepID=UPI001792E670|nr:NAD(P)H-dependent oxidoreductase [Sphingomonas sp.]MBA3666945.1 NAD(P)H-dependent oxidoreductase [Sphingomonas sp.]